MPRYTCDICKNNFKAKTTILNRKCLNCNLQVCNDCGTTVDHKCNPDCQFDLQEVIVCKKDECIEYSKQKFNTECCDTMHCPYYDLYQQSCNDCNKKICSQCQAFPNDCPFGSCAYHITARCQDCVNTTDSNRTCCDKKIITCNKASCIQKGSQIVEKVRPCCGFSYCRLCKREKKNRKVKCINLVCQKDICTNCAIICKLCKTVHYSCKDCYDLHEAIFVPTDCHFCNYLMNDNQMCCGTVLYELKSGKKVCKDHLPNHRKPKKKGLKCCICVHHSAAATSISSSVHHITHNCLTCGKVNMLNYCTSHTIEEMYQHSMNKPKIKRCSMLSCLKNYCSGCINKCNYCDDLFCDDHLFYLKRGSGRKNYCHPCFQKHLPYSFYYICDVKGVLPTKDFTHPR